MRIIHVLRKPLSEGTVAANTLKHGTGGLNIDASRIAGEVPEVTGQGFRSGKYGGQIGWGEPTLSGVPSNPSSGGRWPANVVLQHLDGCKCAGIKRVRSDTGFPAQRGRGSTISGPTGHKGQVHLREWRPQSEAVANWICEPGCPVARLDEQSGVLKSGALPSTQYTEGDRDNSSMFAGDGVFTHQGYKADTGGASRFYKQVGGKVDG